MASVSLLVVDDDATFREAVCRAARALGYAVEQAAGGAEALRFLAAEPPDVLITDMIMPSGDGVELISAVKQSYPTVRILAVSGRGALGPLDLLNLARQLGVDATLAKPFSTEDLFVTLAELVGRRPPA